MVTEGLVPGVFNLQVTITRTTKPHSFETEVKYETMLEEAEAQRRVQAYVRSICESLAELERSGVDVKACGKTIARWAGMRLH